ALGGNGCRPRGPFTRALAARPLAGGPRMSGAVGRCGASDHALKLLTAPQFSRSGRRSPA
ncbi:hypothetical protein B4Q13_18880, partial [Lacticaseibacillus rhamnosus]